jgi:4-carboxymuconolactone decarboxylase
LLPAAAHEAGAYQLTAEPRIPPLAEADRDAAANELLGLVGDLSGLNIFTTMLRHPRFFKRWVPYGAILLRGSLPARDRELLILRTAHRCRCAYEWGHHEVIATAAGLTPDEVKKVRDDPAASGWSGFDTVLIRAADELHDDQRISDPTWESLAERYDDRQLIEVPMLVGHYHAVAFTLNSLGVQLEVEGPDGASP